jgi:diguanylate cyclase (GGDEF)-like protein
MTPVDGDIERLYAVLRSELFKVPVQKIRNIAAAAGLDVTKIPSESEAEGGSGRRAEVMPAIDKLFGELSPAQKKTVIRILAKQIASRGPGSTGSLDDALSQIGYAFIEGEFKEVEQAVVANYFTPEERVRLTFLVFDWIPKPEPDGVGSESGGEGLWRLHELLQRALGRRILGGGHGVAQRIQSFIDSADEEELFTMIELMPRAKEYGDQVNRSPFRYDTRGVGHLMQAVNEFMERLRCPARFGPDGKFYRSGFAVKTLPELQGLPDKRELLSDINAVSARGLTVSVIFVDLDGFKSVNDTLGHEAGDECLASVIRLIGSAILEKGRLYRLGGDEFGVMLPNYLVTEAAATAERTRSSVAESSIGGQIKLTASIGVAEAQAPANPDELVAAADEAMYVSKNTGKNRVTTFPPTSELKTQADPPANQRNIARKGE